MNLARFILTILKGILISGVILLIFFFLESIGFKGIIISIVAISFCYLIGKLYENWRNVIKFFRDKDYRSEVMYKFRQIVS